MTNPSQTQTGMLFTDIFMMFICIKQPQNAEFCHSCKRKVLNMQALDHPGADSVKMTKFSQSNIAAVICRNALDSKNNIALARLLIQAGGEGNHKCTHPMLQLLTKVREAVQRVTHLNNREKNRELLV